MGLFDRKPKPEQTLPLTDLLQLYAAATAGVEAAQRSATIIWRLEPAARTGRLATAVNLLERALQKLKAEVKGVEKGQVTNADGEPKH